jgi:hypothetical protein
MSKKVKVIVSVVAAVVLLTVGTATAVMAQEDGSTANTTGTRGLFARVAGSLNVTEEELIDAFKQARQEMGQEMKQMWQERRQKACSKAIDKAVEKELITQGEAGEIREWWEQRPEAINRFQRAPRFGMWRAHRGWHKAGAPEMTD